MKPASLAERIRQIAAKREQQAASASSQASAEELSAAAEGYRALAEAVAQIPAGQAALAPFVDGTSVQSAPVDSTSADAAGETAASSRDAALPETNSVDLAPQNISENIAEHVSLAAPEGPEPETPQLKMPKEAVGVSALPKANRFEPTVRTGALTPTPRVRISQQLRPPVRSD